MQRRSPLRHVGLLREKSNFELCLGVLPQRVQLVRQERADDTEVLKRSPLGHVGLLQEKSNFELYLGVPPRKV